MGDARVYTQFEVDQVQRLTRLEDKLDALSDSKSEEKKEIEKLKERVDVLDKARLHQTGEKAAYATMGGIAALLISTFGKFLLNIFTWGE